MEMVIKAAFTAFAVALGSSLGCGLTAIYGKLIGYVELGSTCAAMSLVMACISGLSYAVYAIAFRKKYGK